MSFVYDAGVLVAADRNDRLVWAEHRARLELGMAPVTTSPVVAQVSRTGRQAQLRRFLRGVRSIRSVPTKATPWAPCSAPLAPPTWSTPTSCSWQPGPAPSSSRRTSTTCRSCPSSCHRLFLYSGCDPPRQPASSGSAAAPRRQPSPRCGIDAVTAVSRSWRRRHPTPNSAPRHGTRRPSSRPERRPCAA